MTLFDTLLCNCFLRDAVPIFHFVKFHSSLFFTVMACLLFFNISGIWMVDGKTVIAMEHFIDRINSFTAYYKFTTMSA